MPFNFTIDTPMPPIWIIYPNISQFSIGWRMGYGESYKWVLNDWLNTLTPNEKKRYDEMFPKPKFWHNDFEENYYDLIPFWQKNGKMKYSIDKLIQQDNLSKLEYLHFWKPELNANNKFCLGQWQISEFSVDVEDYNCAEQYMMAEKARLFEDEEIEKQIMETSDPKKMKDLGKKVKNFNQKIWDKVKYSIVLNGNYYKFSQNSEMRNFLLSTGDKILVEASPLDTIWGIGLSEQNINSENPIAWKGKNLLGFVLMELRDELKKIYKNYNTINWEELKKYTD